jgi:transcriptional regulator with XRE-family HTH domain
MKVKKSTEEYNKVVGHRINFFRKLRGITQTELAKALGYTSSGTISLIERGIIGMNKAKIAVAAKVLSVHPWVLTTEESLSDNQLILLNKFIKILKQPANPALPSIKNLIEKAIKE